MSGIDAILLAGPTASGKSDWALALAERLPVEIISVDSSQVYRDFDIGAAKPDAAIRERIPHHLIDIRDPQETYSAGEFVRDALSVIADVRARGRMPLLVGGTMLYFKALVRGIAELPAADAVVRAAIDARAAALGWPAMHAMLAAVDPVAAARIHPNDPQRIQRALEVYEISGRPISDWQSGTRPPAELVLLRHALVPSERAWLHERIAQRFHAMLEAGLVEEVRRLRGRADLHAEAPSLRAVGYRQLWQHLDGKMDLLEATRAAIAATRQLAKRQSTWIAADAGWQRLNPLDGQAREHWVDAVCSVCQSAK